MSNDDKAQYEWIEYDTCLTLMKVLAQYPEERARVVHTPLFKDFKTMLLLCFEDFEIK